MSRCHSERSSSAICVLCNLSVPFPTPFTCSSWRVVSALPLHDLTPIPIVIPYTMFQLKNPLLCHLVSGLGEFLFLGRASRPFKAELFDTEPFNSSFSSSLRFPVNGIILCAWKSQVLSNALFACWLDSGSCASDKCHTGSSPHFFSHCPVQ